MSAAGHCWANDKLLFASENISLLLRLCLKLALPELYPFTESVLAVF